jgi:glutathione S-transferase
MKLYYHPNSPNCTDVLATADYLDVQLDLQLVDLLKGAQKDPPFLQLNRVPIRFDKASAIRGHCH